VDLLPHVIPSRLPGHTGERVYPEYTVYPEAMLASLGTRQAVGRGPVSDSRANDLDLREVETRAPAVHAAPFGLCHTRENASVRYTRRRGRSFGIGRGAKCCNQACCLSVIGLATFAGEKIANQLAMTAGHIWLHPEIVERLRKSNPHNCSFQISGSLVDHLAFLFSFIDYISQR
jgi:hypothetical protein